MDAQTVEKLGHLLSREVLKENLAKAGLYSLAFELLKRTIIERPRGFFTMSGLVATDHYKTEVLANEGKDTLIASCRWFEREGVLTAEEIEEIKQLRLHRNNIVHELPNVIFNPKVQIEDAKLTKILHLLSKIDRWWIIQFEIPINEEFDGQEIDPSEVRSGSAEFLEYLIGIVYDQMRTSEQPPS